MQAGVSDLPNQGSHHPGQVGRPLLSRVRLQHGPAQPRGRLTDAHQTWLHPREQQRAPGIDSPVPLLPEAPANACSRCWWWSERLQAPCEHRRQLWCRRAGCAPVPATSPTPATTGCANHHPREALATCCSTAPGNANSPTRQQEKGGFEAGDATQANSLPNETPPERLEGGGLPQRRRNYHKLPTQPNLKSSSIINALKKSRRPNLHRETEMR